MIIYYKQISEGYSDRKRFSILQKVGMSDSEVKKTINKQVKSVFFIPIIAAIIHNVFATLLTGRIIAAMGVRKPLLTVLITVGVCVIYTLIYLIVYHRTSKVYYNLVDHD